MTAHLWLGMLDDINAEYAMKTIPFALMQRMGRTGKHLTRDFLKQQAEKALA